MQSVPIAAEYTGDFGFRYVFIKQFLNFVMFFLIYGMCYHESRKTRNSTLFYC